MTLRYLSLFSGVGGFDLGFDRAGMVCVGQVEIDDYCRRVLAKHWPDVKRMGDIREVRGDEFGTIDVICGGFPCQPHSLAGKRKGAADDRNLWPEYRRLVAAIRPSWVVGENVPGIQTTILDDVLSDLEHLEYTAAAISVPACALDAPHRRERVFIVAYTERSKRRESESVGDERDGQNAGRPQTASWLGASSQNGGAAPVAHADTERRNGRAGQLRPGWGRESENGGRWLPEPGVGRTFDGLSPRLDGPELTNESHECIITNAVHWIYSGEKHDADATEARAGEVLRSLRDQTGTQGVQRSSGGYGCVQAAEILQSYLCQQQEAARSLGDLPLAGAEAQEELLRGLRGNDKPSCSSCGRSTGKQQGGEHTNALYSLPSLSSCHSRPYGMGTAGAITKSEIANPWAGDWENGTRRIASGIPRRVDRLRALGNAVVPQVAEWLGRRIVAAEMEATR